MLADFHFLQPLWLLLLPLLLALSYLWLRVRNTRQYWSDVCDPELLPLLVKEGQNSSRRAPVLAVLVSLLLAVAAAQPVWEKQPRPAFKQGGAVVVAWDLSASMNAVDIKPSRLQRARFKIEDLLSKLQDSQVALLVYAGEAFVVTPLTEDADTIRAQLAAMTPEIMPSPGSRADKALQLAGDMLSQAGVQGGDILLVSDEVEPAQIAAQATLLHQQGRQLSILAVGTAQGAPVPTGQGPLKDKQGKVILARTDLSQIEEAASLGGGNGVMLANDDADLTRLIAGFISKGSKGKRTAVEAGAEVDRWVAKGPWFVLFALPLLLPLFRRGMLNLLLPAVFLSVITAAPDARAGLLQDELWQELSQELWQSQDQRAAQHYQAGDKAAAADLFTDPRWKQVAQYENAEYEAALDSLPQPQTAADWYNRGNVLARSGKLDEAISAYDQALQQQADHADAAYNKKLLEDLQQQQEEQKQQQQDQQDQQQNQQGPQDKQSGQQQDSQNGEQQSDQDQQQPEQNQKSGKNQQQPEPNQQSEQNQQPDSADQQQRSQNQKQNENENENETAETEAAQPANKQTEADQQRNAENEQQAADYLKQQLDRRQRENQTDDQASASQTLQQTPVDEAEQARQQLLNRIVDDPAGLWRRKFIYQYRQQAEKNSVEDKTW